MQVIKILSFLTVIVNVFVISSSSTSRRKRLLLYSLHGSKLQLIFGTGLPIPLEHMSATIGWVMKSAYLVPTNASTYTDPYGDFRKRRSLSNHGSRYQLYRAIERDVLGFNTGTGDCLLRAICEANRIPFKGRKLIGQLMKILLSPSTTDEGPFEATDEVYHVAEATGRKFENDCRKVYPSCSIDLIDFLSVIH